MSGPPDDAALRDLVLAYATAVDTGDRRTFRCLFAEDAVLAISAVADPERIVSERRGDALEEVIDRIARFERTDHRVGRATFAVADDGTATGRVGTTADHWAGGADGPSVWTLHIEYADRYVRTSDGWRFARRTVRVLGESRTP